MRNVFMALAATLIALPILAEQKKPTPTPAASRSSNQQVRGNTQSDSSGVKMRGRVLMQQGRSFTVLSDDGKKFTFTAPARTGDYWTIPNVGDTVEVTYTQTPSGQLEARTVNTTKSNSYKVGGTDANVTATPGPVESTINTSKSNTYREGQPAVTPAPAESINLNSSRSNRVVQQTDPPTVPVEGKPVKQQQQVQQDKQQQKAERMPTLTGRVLSQQGRTFTVQLSDGKTIMLDGSKFKTLPKVGSTVSTTSSGRWVIVSGE
jgi:RNase P/RNase MRP subunit p29